MFQSQASYTFNPLLPFNPYVSTCHFSFDAIPPFAGRQILQSVADFIAPSHSSFSVFKLTPTTLPSLSTAYSQEDSRVLALSTYDSLEDTVSRLLGQHRRLYIAMKNTQTRSSAMLTRSLDFSTKAYFLAEINQFKCNMMNLLCRLAELTLECPQETLMNHFLMIHTALSNSNSFKSILQDHISQNIRELFIILYNKPMTLENSLYTTYIINCDPKSTVRTEEDAKESKVLNVRCSPKRLVYNETSDDVMDILRSKKTTSCSEEDLERHERSSTTSASSRTNPGEVDVPSAYAGFETPNSKKIGHYARDREIGEINSWKELYDGCYFGDLTIDFSSTDKLLFQDEEENESQYSRRKVHHNNRTNYSKPQLFNNNMNQPFQLFNHRVEENHWKANTVSNESNVKTPQQEQKIIPLNLFTIPTGGFMPPSINMFNPVNMALTPPVQPIITPFQTKGPIEIAKNNQFDSKNLSGQKTRDVSRDSHSSFLSDKKQNTNKGPVISTPPGVGVTQKNANMQSQSSKKGNSGKKSYQQSSKKNQDKGGFKLWDMISVQGKLKNF